MFTVITVVLYIRHLLQYPDYEPTSPITLSALFSEFYDFFKSLDKVLSKVTLSANKLSDTSTGNKNVLSFKFTRCYSSQKAYTL